MRSVCAKQKNIVYRRIQNKKGKNIREKYLRGGRRDPMTIFNRYEMKISDSVHADTEMSKINMFLDETYLLFSI
jgi:hypothetical protein